MMEYLSDGKMGKICANIAAGKDPNEEKPKKKGAVSGYLHSMIYVVER
jgi:hypothetical protein